MEQVYRRLTRLAWLGATLITSCGSADDKAAPQTRTVTQAVGSGVVLTTGVTIDGGVTYGRIAINAYAPGAVDLAYAKGGVVYYRDWTDGTTGPIETVGGQADDIMGIARHNGVVTVGMNTGGSIKEATRGSGSWTMSDTGITNPRLQPPGGAYAIDPTTGHGAFVTYETGTEKVLFINETSPGSWTTGDLDDSGDSSGVSFGQFNSLLFTPTGTPIAAYKTTGPTAIKAGAVPSPVGAVTTVDTTAYGLRHTALARAPDGTLYLLDNVSNTDTRLYTSDDDGSNWTHVGPIINVGKSGEFHDYRIAVSPDESLIAALVYDSTGSGAKLTLATSRDRGASWHHQDLPGDPGPQIGDVAFDPEGRLFVAYYRASGETGLRLVATSAPQIPQNEMVQIASAGAVSTGRIALNVYGAGEVDIAWAHSSGTVRYTNWVWDFATQKGVRSDPEIVGGTSDDIMGIARHNGVVTIGMNSGGSIKQAIRGSGSWTIADTNLGNPRLQPPAGAYAVDPTTGYGSFITYESGTNNVVFLKEGASGWASPADPEDLADSGDSGSGASWGQFNSLVYSAAGPIVAFKTTGPTAIRAGGIPSFTGAAVPTVDTTAYGMRHTALARAADGTLYLLDNRDNTDTRLYTSEDNGDNWTHVGPIINVGKSGEFHDYRIAVAPDESLLAALVYDSTGASAELKLATSSDQGVTWQYQSLPEGNDPESPEVAGPQLADLAFDPQGRLYVAYYVEDVLYLIANVKPVNDFEVIVKNTDPEFSKTGSWGLADPDDQINGPFSFSEQVYPSQVTATPGGTAEAEWRFTVPIAGYYRVYTSWTPHPNRAKDSPYTVEYASGATKTIDVNQELHRGEEWVRLGIFYFDTEERRVTLSNEATADPSPPAPAGGTYVIADAIKVVAACPLSPIDVVAGNSSYTAHQLAHETAELMRPMTGLDFQVQVDDTNPEGIAIGVPSHFTTPSFPELDPTDILGQDKYVLRTHQNGNKTGIYLIGASPRAARFAAADLFRRWGYRQFFPGTNWEVVPYVHDVEAAIAEHDVTGEPSAPVRTFLYDSGIDDGPRSVEPPLFDKWTLVNRAVSEVQIRAQHKMEGLYASDPTYFDEPGKGRRFAPGVGQLCLHNGEVKTKAADWAKTMFDQNPEWDSVSMEPDDGGEWCHDPLNPGRSISDQLVDFANDVEEDLDARYPEYSDKIIGILAYNDHYAPPTMTVNADVAVKVTTTGKRGGFSHAEALAGWEQQMTVHPTTGRPKLLGAYEYQSAFPWTKGRPGEAIGADLLNVQSPMQGWPNDGVKDVYNQIGGDWGGYGLSYYMAAQVQWDKDANFDQLLDDFFDKSFGSAKAPMEQLFRLLYRFESTDPTGRHYILSEDLIRRAYGYLNDARQAYEGDPEVLERIYDMVLYTRYMDLYRRYLVTYEPSAPCPIPIPDPAPPPGARQAPFEDWVEFSFRLNASNRMLVHYLPISDLFTNPAALSLFDSCIQPLPITEDPTPFSAEEIDQLIVDGMANNSLISFTPVSYGSDLVQTTSMYQRPVPAGTVLETGFGAEAYTWIPSVSSEPEIRLTLKAGLANPNGNVRVTLFEVDPLGGPDIEVVEDQTTPPDTTEHILDLHANTQGLHKIVIDSQGSRMEASFAEHNTETISARDYEGPILGDGTREWSMYFYVPDGVSEIGGFSSDNTQGEIVDPYGVTALSFSSLLATKGRASHFNVPVPTNSDPSRRIWKFRNCKGRRVLMTVPPYMARHEGKLLLPQAVVAAAPGTSSEWNTVYSTDLVSAAPLGLTGASLDTTVWNRDPDGLGFFTWLTSPSTTLAVEAGSYIYPSTKPEDIYLHLFSGKPGEDVHRDVSVAIASNGFGHVPNVESDTLTSTVSGLHRVRSIYNPTDSVQVNLTAGEPRTFPAGPHQGWDHTFSKWSRYFYVPDGRTKVGGYTIPASSPLPTGTLYDASGASFALPTSEGYFEFTITSSQGRQLWKCVDCSGRVLLMTVPPYMANSALELLLPQEVVTADTLP